MVISTHTSRVGCDFIWFITNTDIQRFLLTHPVWDVTLAAYRKWLLSIFLLTHPVWDVTQEHRSICIYQQFLLTHPVWDVTDFKGTVQACFSISTHTSRVGCDTKKLIVPFWKIISTHTSRVGCDIHLYGRVLVTFCISTHTSRVGCD